MSFEKDKQILKELGRTLAEIGNLPEQTEKIKLWKSLNGLKPVRPMVIIDQLPVNEIATPGDGKLDLLCEDEYLRSVERTLRLTILKWNNFPGDMVVLPEVKSQLALKLTGGYFSLMRETTLATDQGNNVVSHSYEDVLKTEDDLEKITPPVIVHNKAESDRRMQMLSEIFDGVLKIRPDRRIVPFNVWDTISTLKGVGNALDDLIDRPEFVHMLVDRLFSVYRSVLEQYEQMGILEYDLDYIHCTGAFTDELPNPGFNGVGRIQDTWTYTMSQMFSTVSPSMDKEFQMDYVEKYLGDVGLLYYGCCEPLHDRLNLIKKIKNVRKISISPLADVEKSACQLGSEYVLSRKPNPAFLAFESFDEDLIRKDLKKTLDICKSYGTPCELILKDISTVKYKPERLRRWNDIAMELVQE